jgi:N12 class adenine-specific DNA methylase
MMHTGIGVLSFDVGVGKTPSSIFTLSSFLDAGYCKRPFICVPNQVYRQFITELKTFAPHIPINEAYNMSDEIALNFMMGGSIVSVPEGSVTMLTYEGLERIGFGEETQTSIFDGLWDVLSQGEITTAKAKTQFASKVETILGKVEKGTIYSIEDFGWDFGVYDEAHKMKKVFTQVKGEATGKETEK